VEVGARAGAVEAPARAGPGHSARIPVAGCNVTMPEAGRCGQGCDKTPAFDSD